MLKACMDVETFLRSAPFRGHLPPQWNTPPVHAGTSHPHPATPNLKAYYRDYHNIGFSTFDRSFLALSEGNLYFMVTPSFYLTERYY